MITAGQWTNVSLVFDSTSLQPVSVYVNGTAIATTGSAGASTNGVMKSDGNTVNAGVGLSTNGSGRQSLNGYQDDLAVWDTVLSAAQIKAINTAPVVLNGYNAGIMNSLFAAYNGQSSTAVGALTWGYSTAFDVSGHSLGDTWHAAMANTTCGWVATPPRPSGWWLCRSPRSSAWPWRAASHYWPCGGCVAMVAQQPNP